MTRLSKSILISLSILSSLTITPDYATAKDEVKALSIGKYQKAKKEIEGQYTCQPEGSLLPSKFKDDKTHKVSKDGVARRLSASELPKIKGFEVRGLEVTCNFTEDQAGEPRPSYVFEFLKKGKQVALFTHVMALHPSPNGEVFFLENLLKRKKWEHRVRLVNLNVQPKSKQMRYIEQGRCDEFVDWSQNGDQFVMYQLQSRLREACIYNLEGKLTHRWEIPFMGFDTTGASNEGAIILRKDILIHLGDELGPGMCRIDLIELSTQRFVSKIFGQDTQNQEVECNFKPLVPLYLNRNPSFDELSKTLPLLGKK